MDTTTTPDAPKVLHRELMLASEKVDRRDARAFRNAGYGATTGGLAITSRYIGALTKAITTKLTINSERSDSDHFQLERVIRQLPPEVIALVCLQGGLHAVAVEMDRRDMLLHFGSMLAMECFAAKLTKHDPKRAKEIADLVSKASGSVSHRHANAKRLAAMPKVTKKRDKATGRLRITETRAGFTQKHWHANFRLKAGAWCFNMLTEALPDLFTSVEVRGAEGPEKVLSTTDHGLTLANDAVTAAVLRNPVYQPRAHVEPWTSFTKGIAEDPRVTYEVALLRTWQKDIISAANHAVRTGTMKPAMDAVNSLQGVPYMINTWVLDLIQECADLGIAVPGLPQKDAIQITRLKAEEFAKLDADGREVRRKEVAGLKKLNRMRVGDTFAFAQDMVTARNMATRDRFYVPMNMDWRGRVYGISHFNFAREDRVRALFLFADGEPIGENGLYWLAVHVANCGDFGKISKRPMEERVAWVNEHLDEIKAMVQWPTGRAHQWWRDADAPFLFLAACRELVTALRVGSAYVSHMPVSFDGSCSGIQHLAAMMRAEKEASYVNLTNNAEPSDIYQLVADHAKATIEADRDAVVDEDGTSEEIEAADKNRKLARMALDYGVDRKLVKRNVMTFPYSSKVFGMSQQHLEDTMEPLKLKVLKKELEEHPFGDDHTQYAAAKYLAKRTHASIQELVKGPAEAMGFLQTLAQKLAHEGKPLRWTTPAGIPWINRYHDPVVDRVQLYLNDAGVRLRTEVSVAVGDQPGIAKDKAASAVSPNAVHACDAAHLLLTVNECVKAGITSIATVHDSFGCLPSRADMFNHIIRATFVRMYEDHDVLEELLESARADLTPANQEKLPELPAKGTLDLQEILNAKYAFA